MSYCPQCKACKTELSAALRRVANLEIAWKQMEAGYTIAAGQRDMLRDLLERTRGVLNRQLHFLLPSEYSRDSRDMKQLHAEIIKALEETK